MADRLCLATVTSDNYIIGTMVTLDSFRRHNGWFDGDIVILHDGLAGYLQALLSRSFANVRFVALSDTFAQRLDALFVAQPQMKALSARFLSLEAFGLSGYGKILFIDSDLLFRGDIIGLFNEPGDLIACGDGPYVRGHYRDAATFKEIRPADVTPGRPVLTHSFNAGVMLIDGAVAGEVTRRALLDLVTPERWAAIKTHQDDQIVVNWLFNGRVRIVDSTYNFMLVHRSASRLRHMKLADARILHFNGRGKPWNFSELPRTTRRQPALLVALRYWYEAYFAMLTAHHFNPRLNK